MNRVVDASELSDVEVQSVAEAVDIFRAAPTSPSFFTTAPVRDETGKVCEVRFDKDSEGQEPLAVIGIANEGALLPMRSLI